MLLADKSFPAAIAVLFLLQSGYGVLLPTLPFLAERLLRSNGADAENLPLHVGALTAIYPASQILTGAFWGRLSDRIGRKPLILAGIVGYILMQGFTGLAGSIGDLYLVFALGSLLSSFAVPAVIALIGDITTRKDRRLAMAWSGAAVSAGIVSGPAVTGLLTLDSFHLRTSFGHFIFDRYSLPFMVLGVFGIAAFVVAMTRIRAPRIGERVEDGERAPSTPQRTFGYVLILSFLTQSALTSFESAFSLFGKNELSLSPAGLGVGFVLCGVVMAVAQPLLALVPKSDPSLRPVTRVGFSIIAFALLAFPWVGLPAMAYALIVVLALGFGLVIPVLVSTATLQSPQELGKAVGIVFTVNALGQVAGPIIGTTGYGMNRSVPFLVAGVAALLAVLYRPRLASASPAGSGRAF